MRVTLILILFAIALAVAAPAHATASEASIKRAIHWQKVRTWHWQDVAGVRHSPTIRGVQGSHSTGYLAWVERRWNRRRLAAYRVAHRPRIAHIALWLCIHKSEASWYDTGDPYWGGLQMHPDWGYGTSHHASDDTPLEQMAAAERAFAASGYSLAFIRQQWPNTGPPCL